MTNNAYIIPYSQQKVNKKRVFTKKSQFSEPQALARGILNSFSRRRYDDALSFPRKRESTSLPRLAAVSSVFCVLRTVYFSLPPLKNLLSYLKNRQSIIFVDKNNKPAVKR
jgi:hypothetical protein